ncbi:MAG: hypothetical protein AAFN77_11710 [Planctomycetota bacterium]
MLRTLFSLALVTLFAVTSQAQEVTTAKATSKADVKQPTKITLDTEGNLIGKVFADINGEKKPIEAKMTLIREGVTVKSVFADEKGSFSFGSVAPGKYTVSGSAANYVGLEPVAVVAPTPAAPLAQSNNFVLSSPSYRNVAPASSCATCSGGGGGGGFVGGGRLLGGNRRLLRLGLIGGVVAIAVSGDDDASPDGIE